MWNVTIIVETITSSLKPGSHMITDDLQRSSPIICEQLCDRVRSRSQAKNHGLFVRSSPIICEQLCDRVWSRSQAIAGIEPCSIRAIGCDRLRSSAIECDHIWTKFCDYAIGMCPIILCFPSVQHCKRHDTMTTSCLSTFTLACVLTRWKVKLTRNSLWKKLENTIVCSNALAKTSKTSSRRLTPSPK